MSVKPAPAAWTRRLSLVLRIGLAAVFSIAGLLKLRDPSRFALEIGNYQLVPEFAPWLAATLPALEIVAGIGIVALPGSWRSAAAITLCGLIGLLTTAIAAALVRGVNIDCGCFGGGEGPISGLTVVRNLGLLAVTVVVLILDRRSR